MAREVYIAYSPDQLKELRCTVPIDLFVWKILLLFLLLEIMYLLHFPTKEDIHFLLQIHRNLSLFFTMRELSWSGDTVLDTTASGMEAHITCSFNVCEA